jgi:hypothetical protein
LLRIYCAFQLYVNNKAQKQGVSEIVTTSKNQNANSPPNGMQVLGMITLYDKMVGGERMRETKIKNE